MNGNYVRESATFAIAAGAGVGLVAGLLGMTATAMVDAGNFSGGLVGAVAGGATAAYLADGGLVRDVLSALAADVVSSVVFFFLALVLYLGYVSLEEGLAAISAIWFSLLYVVVGPFVAIPVAIISLVIAGTSGTATSLARRALS